ncbi:Hcp family type VI secretion system effector [Photorhabdus caribbeanensis]|uniref:Hcp family type VI secretion system effector n=1 Tax=Photorhabdus caribbeanensis TaxID=1004165 RepID=UPI001BD4CCCA|nr:Hcp family type VI secretion system effector [Photorhabdus caribbeanensis]MBS9425717.1 Hcp family type VI secretion system effector [Photorhabdus caribbeanensis]
MANIIYLEIRGDKQGLISQGCSTVDSIGNTCQLGHEDHIFVYELTSNITRGQHVNHQPVEIRKPIDKSSPLLGLAITNKESLQCIFYFYRTSTKGGLELYYKIKLTGAYICGLNGFYPNSSTHNECQPQESLSLMYKSITWEHIMSGTSAYSIWEDNVY